MTSNRPCPTCSTPLQPDGLCARCVLAEVVSPPRPPAPRQLPTREQLALLFPDHEIGELLGQGGMGLVYRARQRTLERNVALKLLAPQIAAEPDFAERFAREARVQASLAHPHIVTIFEFGQRREWFYFAMELVEGASLRELLRARSLSPRESLAIVAQICDALQYAHDRGVVHRDIKPENVLVDRKGAVKILDFGLSKVSSAEPLDALTRTDQVLGTPHYMAPEQWERPAEVDHRADIYALGVVFYELLTGELPLGRFEPPSCKVAIDVRLDEVVLRTLAKEPERRYQQASAVKLDVEHVDRTSASAAARAGEPAERVAVARMPEPAASVEARSAAASFAATQRMAHESSALESASASTDARVGAPVSRGRGLVLALRRRRAARASPQHSPALAPLRGDAPAREALAVAASRRAAQSNVKSSDSASSHPAWSSAESSHAPPLHAPSSHMTSPRHMVSAHAASHRSASHSAPQRAAHARRPHRHEPFPLVLKIAVVVAALLLGQWLVRLSAYYWS